MSRDTYLTDAESYRTPMIVCEIMAFGTCSFAVCPRCRVSLEREYQNYCDRCGQALKWSRYRYARVVTFEKRG